MRLTLLVAAFLSLAPAAGAQKRIILFIGDGVGASYWTAARFAADNLNVAQFKTMGLIDTRSSNNLITDSAAGATAYSTGVRTNNYAVGVGPDSQPVETVLEAAKKKGWSTGIVATSSVTDATPAAFVSHVRARDLQFDIAKQMAVLAPDVILGGGTRWFNGEGHATERRHCYHFSTVGRFEWNHDERDAQLQEPGRESGNPQRERTTE